MKVWSSGLCCRAAQELMLVMSKAFFLGQSSPGFTGMAEVPGGRMKCWQEELVEVNAGTEGRV